MAHIWTMWTIGIELLSTLFIYLLSIMNSVHEITGGWRKVLQKCDWKKFLAYVSLTLCVLSILSVINSPLMVEAPSTTTLYIDPELTVTQVPSTFSINISIAEVTDLCGWEFKLYYQNSFLNATGYAEGSFLKLGGSTGFYVPRFTDNYNETHGLVGMICTLNDFTNGGVNGSGVLASVTFKAKRAGNSSLILQDTKLRNRNIEPINHTITDGNVQITGTSNIAVTNVNVLKTVLGQQFNMRINVTVENQGEQAETFNVTAYANTTIIDTLMNITLPAGNSTTVTLLLDNTTDLSKGNYTISAYASIIPGETDADDNTRTDGTITVTIRGDVDGDGDVDIYDVVKITSIYGLKFGDLGFNSNSDLDDDDAITIYDVVRCTAHYGEKDP
jgi:hypothetical protein